MKTPMLARVASVSLLLLTGASGMTPASAQGAPPPTASPSALPSRLHGVVVTPVPGARPVEGLDIPKPAPTPTPSGSEANRRQ